MKCKICRKKLTEEELGINELVIVERCISCQNAVLNFRLFLRK